MPPVRRRMPGTALHQVACSVPVSQFPRDTCTWGVGCSMSRATSGGMPPASRRMPATALYQVAYSLPVSLCTRARHAPGVWAAPRGARRGAGCRRRGGSPCGYWARCPGWPGSWPRSPSRAPSHRRPAGPPELTHDPSEYVSCNLSLVLNSIATSVMCAVVSPFSTHPPTHVTKFRCQNIASAPATPL